MAEIRCPHCGKENPDFLDLCQFCQSSLKSDSVLHFGEKPTKKNTGELEGVLPDWLKSARQQSRDSAEDDAVPPVAQPKPRKEEPLDLLAGLAFQSESSDEEDVPDWLSSINPTPKSQPAAAPSQPEPETDFFAQFNQTQPSQQPPSTSETPPASQAPAEQDELSDWFAQASGQPAEPFAPGDDVSQSHSDWGVSEQPSAPKQEEDLSWLRNLEAAAKQTDELKAPKAGPDWERELSAPSSTADQEDLSWLNNLGAIPGTDEPTAPSSQPQQEKEDLSWLDSLGGVSAPASTESAQEDLSWLNNLGGTPVEQPPAQPSAPKEDLSWLNSFAETTPAAESPVSQSSDDLDWLNKLGAPSIEEPASSSGSSQEDVNWQSAFNTPAESSQPAKADASQEDLSWVNNLGGTPPEQPSAPKQEEDLGWLNAFSQTPETSQPAAPQPAAQEDLSWLNALNQVPEESSPQPAGQQDLSWLNSLQGEPEALSSAPFAEPPAEAKAETTDPTHISPFVPRKTAPLGSDMDDSIPDWLKSATEQPSMPMNAGALDQFREDYKIPSTPEEPFSWKNFTQGTKAGDEPPPLMKSEPAFVDPNQFTPPAASSIPSAEDVNSLFSMEMPDWLTQAEPAQQEETSQPIGIHAEGGEALSPADLPSWVQAMRPMDAVISETAPSVESQPTEREGPLAGLRGVIPAIPVGSARRPKPISLKLQATDEQQASASILEQLLAAETSPRALTVAPAVASQRMLRWILAGLFIFVLAAMVGLRSQMLATSALLPPESQELSTRIEGIAQNANVLVVLDYEPALAGEMESVSGPLLDKLALLRRPRLSFLSTSATGPALVERLMSKTNINQASNDGPNYVAGQDYVNLGFLPGADSGVLSFIQSPNTTVPSANVNSFSEYGAVIVLTDNASSARVWVEQMQNTLQPLLIASSAQAGPLLQPYVASGQVDGLISGLTDASRFEFVNNSRPGIARSYWDAFGVGLAMAVALIFLGSLWSLVAGIRARRAQAAEG